MKFKIDKHNKNHVYWLVQDIYETLKHDKYLNQGGPWNWQIAYVPTPHGFPVRSQE